jgi:hypothetical protein
MFQFQNRHIRMSPSKQEAVFATYRSRVIALVHTAGSNRSLMPDINT